MTNSRDKGASGEREVAQVLGFPDYVITSDGAEVWRVGERRGGRKGAHLMTQFLRSGYRAVRLCDASGRPHNVSVHRLVCETFNGLAPCPGLHVAHCDGNPLNNDRTNLRWVTPRENIHDQIRHGTKPKGESVGGAKLTAAKVADIRELRKAGYSYQAIAGGYGVSLQAIHNVCARKTWQHVD